MADSQRGDLRVPSHVLSGSSCVTRPNSMVAAVHCLQGGGSASGAGLLNVFHRLTILLFRREKITPFYRAPIHDDGVVGQDTDLVPSYSVHYTSWVCLWATILQRL